MPLPLIKKRKRLAYGYERIRLLYFHARTGRTKRKREERNARK